MVTCACCNCDLPALSASGELCPECTGEMEADLDRSSQAHAPPMGFHEAGIDLYAASNAFHTEELLLARCPGTRALVRINVAIFIAATVMVIESHNMKVVDSCLEWGPATLGGEWWRMLTSMFLHSGVGHLLGNMWWLWVVGKITERIFSTRTLLALYFLTGLAGALTSLAVHPEIHSAGASGAIFGITGVAIGALWLGRLPASLLRLSWRLWPLLIFTGLSLYGGATNPRIDNTAHVGGLLSGLLLGILLSKRMDHADMEHTRRFEKRVFAAMSLLLVLGAISLRLYYREIVPLAAADQAMEDGRLEEAARITESVAEKRPADAYVQEFLARVYIREGDDARAKAAIDRSLALDPKNSKGYRLFIEEERKR